MTLLVSSNRSSYPDRKEGEDDEELPDDKNLEYDDETLELTLPSGAPVVHASFIIEGPVLCPDPD